MVYFPQLELGYTEKSKYYSLSGIDEAQAYLNHSLLGARLIECCELLKDSDKSIEDILGADAIKFQSSLTLFSQASDNSIFDELLEQFFAGEKDETSLQMLRNNDF